MHWGFSCRIPTTTITIGRVSFCELPQSGGAAITVEMPSLGAGYRKLVGEDSMSRRCAIFRKPLLWADKFQARLGSP